VPCETREPNDAECGAAKARDRRSARRIIRRGRSRLSQLAYDMRVAHERFAIPRIERSDISSPCSSVTRLLAARRQRENADALLKLCPQMNEREKERERERDGGSFQRRPRDTREENGSSGLTLSTNKRVENARRRGARFVIYSTADISHRAVLDLSGSIVPKTEHRRRVRDATDAKAQKAHSRGNQ